MYYTYVSVWQAFVWVLTLRSFALPQSSSSSSSSSSVDEASKGFPPHLISCVCVLVVSGIKQESRRLDLGTFRLELHREQLHRRRLHLRRMCIIHRRARVRSAGQIDLADVVIHHEPSERGQLFFPMTTPDCGYQIPLSLHHVLGLSRGVRARDPLNLHRRPPSGWNRLYSRDLGWRSCTHR